MAVNAQSKKPGSHSAECQFLLTVAANRLHPGAVPQFEAADESRLRLLVERHRLIPLLTQQLASETHPVGMSPQFQTELQRRSFGLAAQSSALIQDLKHIHTVFDAAGIRWLSFKGPVLSMDLYGDPLARPCDDLDLLVHPADLSRAVAVLCDAGFRPEQDLNSGEMKERLRGNWGLDFRSPSNNFLVELKTDIAPRFYALSFRDALPWERPRMIEVDGTAYPTLESIRQTIALAAHGNWHCWERLLWLVDLGLSLDRETPQVSDLLALSDRVGATRMLLSGYTLLRDLLHTPAVELLEARLQHEPESLGPRYATLSANLDNPQTPIPTLKELTAYHLATRERRSDRFRYLHRLLTYSGDGDWKAISLPSHLSAGYRLIRPFRLAARCLARENK